MKTYNCPKCGKQLVRLEPYEKGVYEYWCDDCNTDIRIEAEEEMVKYTIANAKEFCRDALTMPPIDEFESGELDEAEWYEDHKIHIIIGNHEMELEYNADNVNELDDAINEMYDVEMDIKSATTGNTVGNKYRPATLKDVIQVAIQNDWMEWGYAMPSLRAFIKEFIQRYANISKVVDIYNNVIYEDMKEYIERFKCNYGNLDMHSFKNINRETIKRAVAELIGTDREELMGFDAQNRCSDITFIMDHSIKFGGDLIGWHYGEAGEEYINELIEDYKKKLFGEEN